jgi:hypothetical protein
MIATLKALELMAVVRVAWTFRGNVCQRKTTRIWERKRSAEELQEIALMDVARVKVKAKVNPRGRSKVVKASARPQEASP